MLRIVHGASLALASASAGHRNNPWRSLMSKGCAVIVGAGTGTGSEVAKRFAQGGYSVALARRNADALAPLVTEIEATGGKAKAFGADASDEAAVAALFENAAQALGPIEVAIFNAAGFTMGSIVDTTLEAFSDMWRASALGGFLVGREAARRMVPRERGTILFTGATAAMKASANFAAFASGKHGLRAVAQSMAKELGPKGIHVAHAIIDGVIDVPRVHETMPDFAEAKGEDGLIDPKSIAEMYFWLHEQPRNAWTFELDLRPYKEPW
jgi:NAD(P)-dependent dehydrogenase (short-subunit alcohol dehydrogenase family)